MSFRDASDRRKLEAQLVQSRKIEAVGRLAGGIAHDFNNLLTAINGYADLLVKQMAIDHPMLREMEEIRKAGERAASLTRQLLAFSRRQILQPRVLDLLLLTDMVMPGMNGKELAERMLEIYPRMKVILMSGYTEDGLIQWGTIIQGMDFLKKPFRVETLIQQVRKVLDEVPSS